jgi:hypothetical protein
MGLASLISDLDNKLRAFSTRLHDDLGIEPQASTQLASTILSDVRNLPLDKIPTLIGDCPISLKDRFDSLNTLLIWMERGKDEKFTYGGILALNYMCFIYLGDGCFKILRKELPSDSVARKCCQALTDNPVRAFRNALAHGNWRISLDSSGIDFWAKKGSDPTEPMSRWRFSEMDLHFWQYLSIATAVATMAAL